MKHRDVVERIGIRLRMFLPRKLKAFFGYNYRKQRFFGYLRQTFGDRFKRLDQGPIAPPELIETEALGQKDDLIVRATPEWYFGTGYRDAWAVLKVIEEHGLNLASLSSVLEFGCGSGRVLRHFRNISCLRVAGTDANSKPIEWDRRNLPGIEFHENGLEPPLSFADEALDLVYALSVFTHIPLKWQKAWLQELQRVLRPGGYLLCTIHGKSFVTQLNQQDRATLKQDGALTLEASNPAASYSSKVLRSWDVFQTRDEVRERFGAFFELLSYSEEPGSNGQDVLVLRKGRVSD